MLRYAPLNQGAAGTLTVAAASPGNKHKVLGIFFSLANDGTVQFKSDANLLSGAIKIDGQLQPVIVGPSDVPFTETNVGQALNITTTQAIQGVICYITEP